MARKPAGPDEVYTEKPKALDKEGIDIILGINRTLERLKPGKAAGHDEVYTKMLKAHALDKKGVGFISWLIPEIDETGKFP